MEPEHEKEYIRRSAGQLKNRAAATRRTQQGQQTDRSGGGGRAVPGRSPASAAARYAALDAETASRRPDVGDAGMGGDAQPRIRHQGTHPQSSRYLSGDV